MSLRDDVIRTLRKARPVITRTPDFGPEQRRVASSEDLKLPLNVARRTWYDGTEARQTNGTLDAIARLTVHGAASSNASSVATGRASGAALTYAIRGDRQRMAALQIKDDRNAILNDRTDGCARRGADGQWHESTDIRPLGRDAHLHQRATVTGTLAWDATRSEDQNGWAERTPREVSDDAARSALGDLKERAQALRADLTLYATHARCADYRDLAMQIAASRLVLGATFADCVTEALHAVAHPAKLRKALRGAGVAVPVPR